MSKLSISTSGSTSTVTEASTGRFLGHIHHGNVFTLSIVVATGEPVFVVTETFLAAVERFELLINLPASDDCFCGDVRARQVFISVMVIGGRQDAAIGFGNYERTDAIDLAAHFSLDITELRSLHDAIGFALGRLAVIA